ncbi:hypothetical protein EVAR_27495_1 [Eumeta japonica]|uniref:Uncharacterized protein n=1 Tax=Eumeta variegata TaxID=151549 RepID=A0A4C1XDU9_EUMVA|nr:hypothetical protein EVAR_27495_1 [Eumeta japonica]
MQPRESCDHRCLWALATPEESLVRCLLESNRIFHEEESGSRNVQVGIGHIMKGQWDTIAFMSECNIRWRRGRSHKGSGERMEDFLGLKNTRPRPTQARAPVGVDKGIATHAGCAGQVTVAATADYLRFYLPFHRGMPSRNLFNSYRGACSPAAGWTPLTAVVNKRRLIVFSETGNEALHVIASKLRLLDIMAELRQRHRSVNRGNSRSFFS